MIKMKTHELLLFLSLFAILIACGNNVDTNSSSESLNSQVENQDQITPQPSPEDFEAGVFIDFEKYQEQVEVDHVLDSLKSNLEAFINQNEEQFRSIFRDKQAADENIFLFNKAYQYRFNDIETIYKPNAKTINITILGVKEEISSGKQEPIKMLYAFQQNESNEWKVVIID